MTSPESFTPAIATSSLTIGPFFHVGPMNTVELGRMVCDDTPGERVDLVVRVLDGDAEPVSDAMIELWQADASGSYPQPAPPGSNRDRGLSSFNGFGRLGTLGDGSCRFETIRPGPIPGESQAAHINVCVFARGLLRHLYTRVYFEGDVNLARDPIVSTVPADRRDTLVARHVADRTWEFIIRLQGDRETVFFDI